MPRVTNLVLAISLVLAWPTSCQPHHDPVLTPVTKDPSTSLYTIPIRLGANLVVDLAGPLVWSTCPGDLLPASFSCQDPVCKLANAYRAPSCREADHRCDKLCKAHPYNPVTGRCAAGNLVHTRLVANTTDGKNPLSQVSIRAVAACAPRKLLASLPSDSTGVAGMASSGLALPAQVSSSHNVAKKFMLCLPSSGDGVAIFGGGPLYLLPPGLPEITSTLAYTPLLSKKDNPAYIISVKAIAVNQAQVHVPEHALATGGVVLCTRVPYTLLRPDVYRPFVDAFDKALGRNARVGTAVAPFELCYNVQALGSTRLGHAVPTIDLTLEGGKNWTVYGGNSVVSVKENTACLAFVQMEGVKAGDARAPAVLIGGFQMENNLLQFDLEKQQLGFSGLLWGRQTTCSNFNFTRSY